MKHLQVFVTLRMFEFKVRTVLRRILNARSARVNEASASRKRGLALRGVAKVLPTMLLSVLAMLAGGCGLDSGTNPVPATTEQPSPPEPAPPPPDPAPPPPDPVPPDPSAIVATWYGVQANILQRYCTMCHSGPSAPLGLSWAVDQYSTIVTNQRPSSEIPTLLEVNAGNPDASYLMWKLRGQGPGGEPIVGARMPATGIPLAAELIEVVAKWIRDGAPLGVPADAEPVPVGPTYPVGSWMYVWTESLQVCTLCHSRTPSSPRCGLDFSCPPKGVVLTPDNYNGVVDDEEVRPFLPDNSKLWERVTESDPDKRMPFGLPPLSQRQLDIIRNWILDGAPFCPTGAVCPP